MSLVIFARPCAIFAGCKLERAAVVVGVKEGKKNEMMVVVVMVAVVVHQGA